MFTQKLRVPPRQPISPLVKPTAISIASRPIHTPAPTKAVFPSDLKKKKKNFPSQEPVSRERESPAAIVVLEQANKDFPPRPEVSPPARHPNAGKKCSRKRKRTGQRRPATGPKPAALPKSESTPSRRPAPKASIASYAEAAQRDNWHSLKTVVCDFLRSYDLQKSRTLS